MSSPDVERRLRQQGADVESLYEISARIEGQVDALDTKVDQLAENTTAQFDAVNARFDTLEQRTDARFDTLERTNEQTQALLTRILERLEQT
ncbi:hypothetical protein [Pseudonocardia parietis]|uniref:Flagellar capping protein FliD n=1 Tax=Pseudonocardia parietis TaxID=570936 RepID=A0ABS4VMH8_9PSEU|nr:hypothetical protein [Pseudonocardia parietis]MBP2365112.1 flagellar capping protein FliD [Pseudonocardia parietis]